MTVTIDDFGDALNTVHALFEEYDLGDGPVDGAGLGRALTIDTDVLRMILAEGTDSDYDELLYFALGVAAARLAADRARGVR